MTHPSMSCAREALDAERNSLAASHESFAADKERLAVKLQALGSQQEALQDELNSLAAGRRDLEAQRAALNDERSRSAQSADRSRQELATQIAELQGEVRLQASKSSLECPSGANAELRKSQCLGRRGGSLKSFGTFWGSDFNTHYLHDDPAHSQKRSCATKRVYVKASLTNPKYTCICTGMP